MCNTTTTKTTNATEAKEWRKQLRELVAEGKVKDVTVEKIGDEWVMTWNWN